MLTTASRAVEVSAAGENPSSRSLTFPPPAILSQSAPQTPHDGRNNGLGRREFEPRRDERADNASPRDSSRTRGGQELLRLPLHSCGQSMRVLWYRAKYGV